MVRPVDRGGVEVVHRHHLLRGAVPLILLPAHTGWVGRGERGRATGSELQRPVSSEAGHMGSYAIGKASTPVKMSSTAVGDKTWVHIHVCSQILMCMEHVKVSAYLDAAYV